MTMAKPFNKKELWPLDPTPSVAPYFFPLKIAEKGTKEGERWEVARVGLQIDGGDGAPTRWTDKEKKPKR